MLDLWNHIVADFADIGSPEALATFVQVLMIDVMLAGDNAIVVGALAAGLPADQRRKVIMIGVAAALVLRIIFAVTVSLVMKIIGLIFAGGVLLLWVGWRMYFELRITADEEGVASADTDRTVPTRTFLGAAWAVAIADVTMSLDNVLAVAGAAREHPGILVIGLLLSVALMGVAANFIARFIERYRWLAYVGLGLILYVALKMIWQGAHQLAPMLV
jgi:YjbE family integral membrane protein